MRIILTCMELRGTSEHQQNTGKLEVLRSADTMQKVDF